jgi:hypothetical protein
MNPIEPYSTAGKIVFWLLWLFDAAVALLFVAFLFLVGLDAWPVVLWNLAIVLVQGFVLFKMTLHFSRKDKAMSDLLLWLGLAATLTPMIAFGGCAVVSSFSPMRFAG